MSAMTLRCALYRDDAGLYVAECIDLYIIVKAKTEKQARQDLKQAVNGHVRVAREVGEESLLRRPSPFLHRMRYHFGRALNSFTCKSRISSR